MTAEDTGSPCSVLVVASQPLVAQDIALTLLDQLPQARIITAASMAAGFDAIDALASLAMAWVGAAEAAFAGAPLWHALAAKGAMVCLIGPRSSLLWPTLPIPFTTKELVLALKTISPGQNWPEHGRTKCGA